METAAEVADINSIAEFLADQPVQPSLSEPVDCIVICVSAILYQAEWLFALLMERPHLTKTLVLCGGKGHSTELLYKAIAENPKYAEISPEIEGLAESRVLEKLANRYYDIPAIQISGCKILIEDQSTNCGSNATETRELLRRSGCLNMRRCVIIQDPTMARRTRASFIKAFSDISPAPDFVSCPVFVPRITRSADRIEYAIQHVPNSQLWDMERFFELLMGEIPRLRDDEGGYGPKGRGYIPHVEIPTAIEQAWVNLASVLKAVR
jgi:uncharacterized SAM-binding protein YcdF (DUF218 family)